MSNRLVALSISLLRLHLLLLVLFGVQDEAMLGMQGSVCTNGYEYN